MLLNFKRKPPLRRGFTLVELLVVISIIALLLSVLMPSLGKAREQGRRVVCMSNIKQVGNAWFMYTMDNGDRFPVWKDRNGNRGKEIFWGALFGAYLGEARGESWLASNYSNADAILERHNKVAERLRCPSVIRKDDKPNWAVSYGLNWGVFSPPTWGYLDPGLSIGQVSPRLVVLSEGPPTWPMFDGVNAKYYWGYRRIQDDWVREVYRHNYGMHYLSVDMSVEYKKGMLDYDRWWGPYRD